MSICDRIKELHEEGRLFLVPPGPRGRQGLASDSTTSDERYLWVSYEINEHLRNSEDERWMGVAADIALIPEGRRLWLRRENSDQDNAMSALMVRLKGKPSEIWEIRSTEEQPQVRLFGRFACKDCFVALSWSNRDDVECFSDEMNSCEEIWRDLFGYYEPLKGAFPDGYLSNTKFVP